MAFGRIAEIRDVYIPRVKKGIRWEEDDYGKGFGVWDEYALSPCASSVGVSYGIAAGIRCDSLQLGRYPSWSVMNHILQTTTHFLNSSSSPTPFQVPTAPDGADLLAESNITMELIGLTVLAMLWTVGMLIFLNGDAHYSVNRDVLLTLSGE